MTCAAGARGRTLPRNPTQCQGQSVRPCRSRFPAEYSIEGRNVGKNMEGKKMSLNSSLAEATALELTGYPTPPETNKARIFCAAGGTPELSCMCKHEFSRKIDRLFSSCRKGGQGRAGREQGKGGTEGKEMPKSKTVIRTID